MNVRMRKRIPSIFSHSLSTISSRSVQDRHDPRPTRPCRNRHRPGPLQCSQAPGGREPGEAELGPIFQRQLKLRRSAPTRQEPTDGADLEGLPGESGGREPRAPRDRPVRRPTLRPGLRAREIQDGDRLHAARLPFHDQEPGQIGGMEAPSDRIIGDPQPFGDRIGPPTILASESTAEESAGHSNAETGRGEPVAAAQFSRTLNSPT